MPRMRVIDSKEELVPEARIVVLSVDQVNTKYPLAVALALIAKEGSMPSADTKQFGNTVFLTHRGVGENQNKTVGRAFNIDTARNYINNVLVYLEYLRVGGITHYTTMFSGSEVFKLIKIIERTLENSTDTVVFIKEATKSDSEYMAFVKFGKQRIPESIDG
jgi:asparagine N-glycosylation enzyme membrane subunit Stt3